MANAAPAPLEPQGTRVHTAGGASPVDRWPDFAVDVLELLSDGVFVVDGDGRVRGMNGAARRILDQPGGLSLGADGLRNGSAGITREITRRIRAAACGAGDPSPMRIAREGRPPLRLRVVSLESREERRAVVFVSDVGEAEPPSAEQIMDRFGTTPMESKVAHRLARGSRVEAIAEDLGIAVQTVRGHLKQAFAKTGAHRQAELVALIHAMPSPCEP